MLQITEFAFLNNVSETSIELLIIAIVIPLIIVQEVLSSVLNSGTLALRRMLYIASVPLLTVLFFLMMRRIFELALN